MELFALLRS